MNEESDFEHAMDCASFTREVERIAKKYGFSKEMTASELLAKLKFEVLNADEGDIEMVADATKFIL